MLATAEADWQALETQRPPYWTGKPGLQVNGPPCKGSQVQPLLLQVPCHHFTAHKEQAGTIENAQHDTRALSWTGATTALLGRVMYVLLDTFLALGSGTAACSPGT